MSDWLNSIEFCNENLFKYYQSQIEIIAKIYWFNLQNIIYFNAYLNFD